MSIKFNWGTGIFIFIVIFLISMLGMVYLSFQENNELVEDAYYPQGMEYQQQIDRKAKVKLLSATITTQQVDKTIVVTYPDEFAEFGFEEGQVYFYRPSSQESDLREAMQPDTTLHQYFTLEKFRAGKYIVKYSWTMQGEEYYDEQSLMITK
jgi:hypothetical protein